MILSNVSFQTCFCSENRKSGGAFKEEDCWVGFLYAPPFTCPSQQFCLRFNSGFHSWPGRHKYKRAFSWENLETELSNPFPLTDSPLELTTNASLLLLSTSTLCGNYADKQMMGFVKKSFPFFLFWTYCKSAGFSNPSMVPEEKCFYLLHHVIVSPPHISWKSQQHTYRGGGEH